jgi:hypothetical protein
MQGSSPQQHRNASLLEEMGFGAINDSGKKLQRKLSRRSSIGLSDFWSEQEKERFLRKNGLWDAFKEIKKHEMIEEAQRKKVKHASLPRIIDINTIQKVNSNFQNACKETRTVKTLSVKNSSLSESPVKPENQKSERVLRINSVVNDCNSLAKELDKFRKLTLSVKKSFNKKPLIQIKKKISRHDLKKIKLAIKNIK